MEWRCADAADEKGVEPRLLAARHSITKPMEMGRQPGGLRGGITGDWVSFGLFKPSNAALSGKFPYNK